MFAKCICSFVETLISLNENILSDILSRHKLNVCLNHVHFCFIFGLANTGLGLEKADLGRGLGLACHCWCRLKDWKHSCSAKLGQGRICFSSLCWLVGLSQILLTRLLKDLFSITEVALRRARLVLGWVNQQFIPCLPETLSTRKNRRTNSHPPSAQKYHEKNQFNIPNQLNPQYKSSLNSTVRTFTGSHLMMTMAIMRKRQQLCHTVLSKLLLCDISLILTDT